MKLIFEIAAIGIVTSLLSILLDSAGKKDLSSLIYIAGTISSILLLAKESLDLLNLLKGL